jgi:vacuolar-type H+-ATPase subunit D/Vma8
MNVTTSEEPYEFIAKTCGCKERNRKVTYSFIDAYHGLCKDKKDIVLSEIQACERLINDTRDEIDKNVIETVIAELKLTQIYYLKKRSRYQSILFKTRAQPYS